MVSITVGILKKNEGRRKEMNKVLFLLEKEVTFKKKKNVCILSH